MCPWSCCCPQCPPHPPSDGNKGPPRQSLSPYRPLARLLRAESPRHTPGTPSRCSGAAAAILTAIAACAGGQLLAWLACTRRNTFWLSLIRSHTPTLPPRACPLSGARAHVVGAHAGRLSKTVEAGNGTTDPLLRLFVVLFGWSLEVAEPLRKPGGRRRQA